MWLVQGLCINWVACEARAYNGEEKDALCRRSTDNFDFTVANYEGLKDTEVGKTIKEFLLRKGLSIETDVQYRGSQNTGTQVLCQYRGKILFQKQNLFFSSRFTNATGFFCILENDMRCDFEHQFWDSVECDWKFSPKDSSASNGKRLKLLQETDYTNSSSNHWKPSEPSAGEL